jgi:putative YphP/YqiW family bacilliredoxin
MYPEENGAKPMRAELDAGAKRFYNAEDAKKCYSSRRNISSCCKSVCIVLQEMHVQAVENESEQNQIIVNSFAGVKDAVDAAREQMFSPSSPSMALFKTAN